MVYLYLLENRHILRTKSTETINSLARTDKIDRRTISKNTPFYRKFYGEQFLFERFFQKTYIYGVILEKPNLGGHNVPQKKKHKNVSIDQIKKTITSNSC